MSKRGKKENYTRSWDNKFLFIRGVLYIVSLSRAAGRFLELGFVGMA